nr:MAG TPA_asm: hypothetical protein [Bacteriophage sp.]
MLNTSGLVLVQILLLALQAHIMYGVLKFL